MIATIAIDVRKLNSAFFELFDSSFILDSSLCAKIINCIICIKIALIIPKELKFFKTFLYFIDAFLYSFY